MADNDVQTSEDAEMSECDGQKVVTMMDVLQEQQDFEEDANAVLGASDDKNCTYSKGYVKRQAIYACLTCCPDAKTDPMKRAGVCLACSLTCHENHDLVELYTKRNFRCDCGNPKLSQPCQFTPNKSDLNYDNKYNQNFSGIYCTCQRPYPDPDCTDEQEMIQCIICEDWHHTDHLEATVPTNDQYSEMICKDCMEDNDFLHDYSELVVNITDKEIILTDPDLDVATILRNKAKKEAAAKSESATNGVNETSTDKEPADKPKTISNAEKENVSADADMAEGKPESNGVAKDAGNPELSEQTDAEKKEDKTEPESTDKVSVENKESTEATDKPEVSNEADSASETKEETKAESSDEKPKQNEEDNNVATSQADKTSPETKQTDTCPEKTKDEIENNVESSESPEKSKRKLSTEDSEDTSPKKAKLDTNPCIRPRGIKRVYKGATFWPSNFRQKLCTCNDCVAMYKDLAVLFLTDQDDTVTAYEALGKIFTEGTMSSQYEKGLQALSSLDRVQQINALTEYNKMRDKLLDFLKSFKDRKEIVKEEDIKAFFAGMKPKREPDGVYFCR